MRIRDHAVGVAFFLALAILGYGAHRVGANLGRPDAPATPALQTFPLAPAPLPAGLYGFEGLGEKLELGIWGVIESVEPGPVRVEVEENQYQEVTGLHLRIRQGDIVSEIQVGRPTLIRTIVPGQLQDDALIALGEKDGAVAVLLIR